MAGNPLTDQNWANDTADQIIGLVGKVSSQSTDRAVMVVRGVVIVMLGVFVGVTAVVLLLALVLRLVHLLLDMVVERDTAVWITYIGLGMICLLIGLKFLSARKPA